MSSLKRATSSRVFVITVLLLVIAFGSVVVYFTHPFQTNSYPHVGPNRAAIVDGLSELNPNPEFVSETVRYLEAGGLSVDVYTAPELTVEFMKSFPAGYELVIFRVHSSTSRRGVFYFTSEPYDESKYEPEQFRDELRPAKDYEGNPPVFAFGSKFVNTYLEGRFRGAIIIGMGCFGAGVSYGTEEEVTIENVSVSIAKGPNLADAFFRQNTPHTQQPSIVVFVEWSNCESLASEPA